jgi:microcystin-dependent protein
MNPFLGEIRMFAGNFAPRNWAFCNGQILPISQNTALFSLLGTNYGGNGQTTFALPDLRGRSPIHQGQGPGLSPYVVGETAGSENVTLITTQMPAHTHVATGGGGQASIGLPCSNNAGNTDTPSGNIPAVTPSGDEQYVDAASANGTMAPVTLTIPPPVISITGGSLPHENRSPYLAVSFIIALNGVFPSRN